MERELEALQWITLGSIGVLIVLCGLLLAFVWQSMNFIQITERLRATLGSFTTEARWHGDLEGADDDRGPPALSQQSVPGGESGTDPFRNGRGGISPRPVGQSTGTGSSPSVPPCLRGESFRSGQIVKVIHELDWIGGSGVCVPVGALITLRESFDCSHGRRWTADWKRTHLHSVPEDMFEAIPAAYENTSRLTVGLDNTRCEREWIAQQQAAHEANHTRTTATG